MARVSDSELRTIAIKVARESGAVPHEIEVRVDVVEPGIVRLVSLARGAPRLLLDSNGRTLQYVIPSAAAPDDETALRDFKAGRSSQISDALLSKAGYPNPSSDQ